MKSENRYMVSTMMQNVWNIIESFFRKMNAMNKDPEDETT